MTPRLFYFLTAVAAADNCDELRTESFFEIVPRKSAQHDAEEV